MIDPQNITDYNRTDAELEELLLFAAAVTAKTAVVVAKQLDNFLSGAPGSTPFKKVENMIGADALVGNMKTAKLGQYKRLEKAFTQIVKLNPRTCTVDDLEKVHGIGPKTARFFILHSRPNQRVAALDTHMMTFLREKGYTTLDNTPSSSKVYKDLEKIFIEEADKAGKSVAEFDLSIWNKYSKYGNTHVKKVKLGT